MGKPRNVHYTPEASPSLCPPAIPLVVVGVFADDGDFWVDVQPVVAVYAKVTTCYQRPARSEFDGGTPAIPPSQRSLHSEGYRMIWSPGVHFGVLVVGLDGTLEDPFEASECNGVKRLLPSASLREGYGGGGESVPPEIVKEMAKDLNEPYRSIAAKHLEN